jgi:hypothetical protein
MGRTIEFQRMHKYWRKRDSTNVTFLSHKDVCLQAQKGTIACFIEWGACQKMSIDR